MRYIILLLVVAFVGCKSGANFNEEIDNHETDNHEAEESVHSQDEIVFTDEQALAAGVVIDTIGLSEFSQVIKVGGEIQSPQGGEEVVVATSSGIVSFSNQSIADGQPVQRGQSIVTISAQNIVDGDPAVRARIEYETAQAEYRRAEELVKEQIISQKVFNEAKQRYDIARSAYPATMSSTGVKVACSISGFIKNLLVKQGEYVAVGQPVATISQNQKLQLRAEVSERYFGQLSTITGANFRLSYDDKIYHTDKLISYGRSAEGFYIPVLFEFANVGDVIPGSYVEVWLLGKAMPNVISVPKSAITEEQGLYFVYLQHSAEDYAKQEVSIGHDNGERVEITKGLKVGDRVVVNGVYQLRLAANSSVIPEGHTH